jgi:tRNA U34 5-methylaminomethyl-2-thiouridine-forming methyltransferase MnmC
MKRIIQITEDGSQTISVAEMNVNYHSAFGAVQESMHVFINAGLQQLPHSKEQLNIFEMGFGTGLNALLTLQQAINTNQKIYYSAIELYPLEKNIYEELNYSSSLNDLSLQQYFLQLHSCNWEEDINIHPLFTFQKSKISLIDFTTDKVFDIIYFDAFDPSVQPDLWSATIFSKLFDILFDNGILTTYSSKGDVRRAMLAAGFSVEKIPGPPGKREMMRAIKR